MTIDGVETISATQIKMWCFKSPQYYTIGCTINNIRTSLLLRAYSRERECYRNRLHFFGAIQQSFVNHCVVIFRVHRRYK
jgi:hypothetical protein